MDDLEGLAIICCPNCGVNFGLKYEAYQTPQFNWNDADDGPSQCQKEPVEYRDIEWMPTSQSKSNSGNPRLKE
ncbi:MAG: hypothetical protein F4X65_10360 [Chloroflexi bacterium]|nr:hypothetical protein [Chloroflexota bacterium]